MECYIPEWLTRQLLLLLVPLPLVLLLLLLLLLVLPMPMPRAGIGSNFSGFKLFRVSFIEPELGSGCC